MIGDVSHDGLSLSMLLSVLSAVDSDLDGLFGAMWPASEEVGRERLRYHVVRSKAGAERASREERSRAWREKRMLYRTGKGAPAHTRGAMRPYRTERYAGRYSVQHPPVADHPHSRS